MLLYIHIPFCDSKCFYCAFNSYTDKNHLKKQYTKALIADIRWQFERFEISKKSFSTLFIGGGTPSCLPIGAYEEIFKHITPYLQDGIEMTTEVNPSLKKEWIEGMRDVGINRVSVGVQSFNDEKLKLLGRSHSGKRAYKAVEMIYQTGIEHISLDLIYEVNIDSKPLLSQDLQTALSLPINHLSSYALTIEENTPFYTTPRVRSQDEALSLWWVDLIKKQGFTPYETSNFAKQPSYRSKHNMGYWSYKPYIGVGCGAIGGHHNRRWYTTTHLEKYIASPCQLREEVLSPKDRRFEQLFLGLRSIVGVKWEILTKGQQERATHLIKSGNLHIQNDTIYNRNFMLADGIVEFIGE